MTDVQIIQHWDCLKWEAKTLGFILKITGRTFYITRLTCEYEEPVYATSSLENIQGFLRGYRECYSKYKNEP